MHHKMPRLNQALIPPMGISLLVGTSPCVKAFTRIVSNALQVTVTTHPASSVSLSSRDMLAGNTGGQLGLTALAGADHEWRVLRFNNVTRQSVCRVLLPASGGPALPVPVCIATEYLKSMLASGLPPPLGHTSHVHSRRCSLLLWVCLGILCLTGSNVA